MSMLSEEEKLSVQHNNVLAYAPRPATPPWRQTATVVAAIGVGVYVSDLILLSWLGPAAKGSASLAVQLTLVCAGPPWVITALTLAWRSRRRTKASVVLLAVMCSTLALLWGVLLLCYVRALQDIGQVQHLVRPDP